jgi:hypothetical protein
LLQVVAVMVGVLVMVGDGVSVGVLLAVSVGVRVGLSVAVLLGVAVGLLVAVLLEVAVGLAVAVLLGVGVGVLVGLLVGVLVMTGVFVKGTGVLVGAEGEEGLLLLEQPVKSGRKNGAANRASKLNFVIVFMGTPGFKDGRKRGRAA